MTQGKTTKQGKSAHNKQIHRGKRHRKNSKRNQLVLMRWGVVAIVLIAAIIFLTRCSGGKSAAAEEVPVDETASRVEFTKKGALTVTSVETFDKDYYDQAELQETIDSEIASYNDANGGGVSAGDLTVENGTAILSLKYDAAADYVSFNDQEMFWGTLQEAEDAGYDLSGLSGTVNAQDTSETFGEGTALALANNTLIAITEPLDVLTPTAILYASSNLKIANSDYATVTGDVSEDNPAILILK